MRNGNSGATDFQKGDVIGSYRTYEEWKHGFRNTLVDELLVLTVPMRNGNNNTIVDSVGSVYEFLPYL